MSESGSDAPPGEPGEITRWLVAWREGDQQALERLTAATYGELHRIAERLFARESPGQTLQPTALVHEAFLRLIDQERVDWRGRAQFFGLAATLMRRILVDRARRRGRAKRGGGWVRTTVSAETPATPIATEPIDLLALDEALQRLARLDRDQERLVELRFFGGLTIEETAAALEVSTATVERDWASARAFLARELGAAERAR